MLLNSHSSKKKNTQQKRTIKSKSHKRNFKNIIKHQEKPQKYISKFQLNKIYKSNKIIEYSSLSNTLNIFKEGKSSENLEQNSTFIFTGDFENNDETEQIIYNYLKKKSPLPIFDCKSVSTISMKEDYEITFSKENSFTLSSSKTSSHSKKNIPKIKEKNNQKLMSILKKINSSSNSIENRKNSNIKKILIKNEKNNNKFIPDTVPQKLNEKIVKKEKIIKKKNSKKIYFALFIFINIIFYVSLIMKLFEPSVESLFYDNDHDNYIYSTNLLSQDRSLVANK